MALAGTALCFVLLSSNSPEKQPTPSPCQRLLTSRRPGTGLCPAHCAALVLGLPPSLAGLNAAATLSRPSWWEGLSRGSASHWSVLGRGSSSVCGQMKWPGCENS